MAVYKGSYYFNTYKGRFIYLYFEGTNQSEFIYLPVNELIQASCMDAVVTDNVGTTTHYRTYVPINIKDSGAQIVLNTTLWYVYADIANGNVRLNLSGSFDTTTPAAGKFDTSFFVVYKNTNTGKYYCSYKAVNILQENAMLGLAHPTANTFGLVTITMYSSQSLGRANIEIPTAILPIFTNGKVYIPSNDPYKEGGISDTGGGNGDFDNTSDPIDIPPLPAVSAVDTGFMTLFTPSLQNMRDLAAYMWANPLFDVNAYKKILANPMDAILGLSLVPVTIPANTAKQVTVGNIPTGISMPVADNQFIEVDCGSINVNEHWGAYLDYAPYTKCELYLPYCGIHPIDTDDIMATTVKVVYHVDILTGACCAYVKCGDSVLYTFAGQLATTIPITGNDWTSMINGIINATTAIGSMAATGGLTAPMAVSEVASTVVNTAKPTMERSGSLSGTGGMMATQYPYLILTRPRQALPELQNRFSGYPSFISSYLSDLSGYTEVYSVHLEGISATGVELSEIEQILKGGVIL